MSLTLILLSKVSPYVRVLVINYHFPFIGGLLGKGIVLVAIGFLFIFHDSGIIKAVGILLLSIAALHFLENFFTKSEDFQEAKSTPDHTQNEDPSLSKLEPLQ